MMQTLAQQLIKKGEQEEKLKIAREPVRNGVDIDIIARSTGLPPDKIEQLASVVQ